VSDPTSVALALGSGGARGFAHIGAIQVIEERGFEVVSVAGSSMGALVGGLYAAGKLAEYTDWVTGLTQLDVVRLLDVSVSAPGAIRAEKILARVRDLLEGALIEDLPIEYTAVATDLFARKEVWFQKGLVETAVRASIAIPGIITPVMLNGRLLADGGIMDPIPIAPTAAARADVTIAISLAGEHRGAVESPPVVATTETEPVAEWSDRFRRSAAHLLDLDLIRSVLDRFGGDQDEPETEVPAGRPPGESFETLPDGLSKFDVMNLSLEAMQSLLARYRLAGYGADVLIDIPKDSCRTLDFHRADEMVALGRTLTSEALDRAGLGLELELENSRPENGGREDGGSGDGGERS
jgi:NTE family protein